MSARREQTAEETRTALTEAAARATVALQSLRHADGHFSSDAEPEASSDLDSLIRQYISGKKNGVALPDLRDEIRAQGGIEAASVALKLELARAGLIPRAAAPPVLDPAKLPVWTRPGVVALSILQVLEAEPSKSSVEISELHVGEKQSARGWGLRLGFLERRSAQRAGEWLRNNGSAFHTPAVDEALKLLGYAPITPERELPVRETAIAARALQPHQPTSNWLLQQATRGADAETTAAVILALPADAQSSVVDQLLALQSPDGGWPAYDSATEPSCPDITGHVLQALIRSGVPQSDSRVQRAIEYLFNAQELDGSWAGAMGVAYSYGTFRVLEGLKAAGVSDREAPVLRAGEWLRSVQNADGGWGESTRSFTERLYVPGPSTPSQTAWAILGLLAGGDDTSLSIGEGIEYLLKSQGRDGAWSEQTPTAAALPRTSFRRIPLYRIVFPLLALSSYEKAKHEVANS